jgi:hypothetical protein
VGHGFGPDMKGFSAESQPLGGDFAELFPFALIFLPCFLASASQCLRGINRNRHRTPIALYATAISAATRALFKSNAIFAVSVLPPLPFDNASSKYGVTRFP